MTSHGLLSHHSVHTPSMKPQKDANDTALAMVWQYKGNDGRFSTGNFFFFRLISVTSKAKEGHVAILG